MKLSSLIRSVLPMAAICMASVVAQAQTKNMLTFFGNEKDEQINGFITLSDSTVVAVGKVGSTAFFPQGSVRPRLTVPQVPSARNPAIIGINSNDTSNVGVLIHLTKNLDSILAVVPMPRGVGDVSRIRTNTPPGQPTGDLYISGRRDFSLSTNNTVNGQDEDGYYLAKLNGNFINQVPSSAIWTYDADVRTRRSNQGNGPFPANRTSDHKIYQTWDVSSDGRIFFVSGREFSDNWAEIGILNRNGHYGDTVNYFTRHVLIKKGPISPQYPNIINHGVEFNVSPGGLDKIPDTLYNVTFRANPGVNPAITETLAVFVPDSAASWIILKMNRGGSNLRSFTADEFNSVTTDENGFPRKGSMPDDYYYTQPCLTGNCPNAGPGYTGYSYAANGNNTTTGRCVGLQIDKRNNDMFFSYTVWSRATNNAAQFDFEPAVVAMNQYGQTKWWARLYREDSAKNAEVPQVAEFLDIDYTNNELLVVARQIGKANRNFWDGDSLTQNPGGNGFQNRFNGTVTQDNDVRWMAKYTLATGQIKYSTWMGEPTVNTAITAPSVKPNSGGFNDPNIANYNMANTAITSVSMAPNGDVIVGGFTEGRSYTTNNALIASLKPDGNATFDSLAGAHSFLRVYSRDLSNVIYSSVLAGTTDPTTGAGGANTSINAVMKAPGEGYLFGGVKAKDGGNLLTINRPKFGTDSSKGNAGILGRVILNCGGNRPAKPDSISGPKTFCAGTSATFKVSPVSGATAYVWSLPTGTSFVSDKASGDSVVIRAVAGGTFSGVLRVVAINECGASEPVIFKLDLPGETARPTSLAVPTGGHCVGDIRTYRATGAPTSTQRYQWTMPNAGFVPVNAANQPAPGDTVTTADSIRVLVTTGTTLGGFMRVRAGGDCGLSQALQRQIVAPLVRPNAPDSIRRPTGSQPYLCIGTSRTYNITAVPGALTNGYTWTLPTGYTGTSTGITISVTAQAGAGPGVMSVTASNGCGASLAKTLALPQPLANPGTVTIAIINGKLVITSAKQPTFTYQWRRNSNNVTNATDTALNPDPLGGTYTLVVTNGACGSSTSNSVLVQNIPSSLKNGSLSVYPNPTAGKFNVELPMTEEAPLVYVTDLLGKRIANLRTDNESGTLSAEGDLSSLSKGIYFVVAQYKQRKLVTKLVKD